MGKYQKILQVLLMYDSDRFAFIETAKVDGTPIAMNTHTTIPKSLHPVEAKKEKPLKNQHASVPKKCYLPLFYPVFETLWPFMLKYYISSLPYLEAASVPTAKRSRNKSWS